MSLGLKLQKRRPFLPHQVPAFDYAKDLDRILLFMEMRLGKSMVAIRWALARGYRSILIVAPRSTLSSWQEELEMEGQHSFIIRGPNRVATSKFVLALGNNGSMQGMPVFGLVNPESIIPRRTRGEFSAEVMGRNVIVRSPILEMSWDCVIVDESARIRNPQAMITKVLTRRCQAKGRAVLCGLPNPEGPIDFFCQFQFVYGHFMHKDNYWAWKNRYYRVDPINPYVFNPAYGTMKEVKEFVHDRAFVLSRFEAKVGSRKFYEKRTVDLNGAQKKLIEQAKEDYECGDRTTEHIIVVLTWLARIAGGFHPITFDCINKAKPNELLALLKGELSDQSTIVFFRFNAEMFFVQKLLEKKGISCRMIYGNTSDEDRTQFRQDFQAGKFQTLLCQVKCGKVGLDLSKSSTTIYYSNTFSNDDRAQSEDRLIHPQKKSSVLLIDLVSEDSTDEDVVSALRHKRRMSVMMLIKCWEERWGI